MGTGSRFFIGQLMTFLFGDHISEQDAVLFVYACLVILILLTAFLVNYVLKRAEKKILLALWMVLFCFLCAPSSYRSFWTEANLGRLEMY